MLKFKDLDHLIKTLRKVLPDGIYGNISPFGNLVDHFDSSDDVFADALRECVAKYNGGAFLSGLHPRNAHTPITPEVEAALMRRCEVGLPVS